VFLERLFYTEQKQFREVTMKKILAFLLSLLLTFSLLTGCGAPMQTAEPAQTEILLTEVPSQPEETDAYIDPYGSYTTKEDVALYIHLYGDLPLNFMTKKHARALGWEGGSLEPVAPGMCIGGGYFGNYEGLLPEDREYTECDIDTLGKDSRGAKRIVFSEDGLIYYTEDHYESFELLYGEP
jgi:hypothetical protein